jgi:hypothetical protein
MGVGGRSHAPAAVPPGKNPVPIVQEDVGGGGVRARLDWCGKSRLHGDLIPKPSSP